MRKLGRRQRLRTRAKRSFNHHAVTVGSAAAITLTGQAGLAKVPEPPTTDAHQIVVEKDTDGDLLTDRDEAALGYQAFSNDQNNNGKLDGAELAMRCALVVAELPLDTEVTSPGQTYRKDWQMFGMETCSVCGKTVNMGTIEIVNPGLGLRVEMPVLAVHYMEHGSLSYAGSIHEGRIGVAKLARALALRFPCQLDDHQLPLAHATESYEQIAPDANDLDGDLLADSEELAAGMDLYDADQDNNLLPDGIQLAQRCAEIIDSLPAIDPTVTDTKGVYKISYMMRGVELCEICGESVNMGYWQIVNAESGVSLDVPEIARHFMGHGSFSYLGSVHGGGRAEVAHLLEVLGFPSACGDLGTSYAAADLNKDCKVDSEDFTEFVEQWLDSIEPAEK